MPSSVSRVLPALALIIFVPSVLCSHGGGLDRYGCHQNRVQGGYHCHRGAFKGAMFDSQAEMLQQLKQAAPPPAQRRHKSPRQVILTFTGKVVGVTDGDTITVMHNLVGEKVRLNGIDCPERRQAFGNRAKQAASELVFGKTVTVQVVDYDRYKRTVGNVVLSDGLVLNEELVRAGMCWWYRRYALDDERLAQAELEARVAKRGLWVAPDPVPPWEWRAARKRYR